MSRRPSSTKTRRDCFEHWATAYGITRILKCYLCGRVWEEKDWSCVTAEHEIPRSLGLARFGKEIDKPWNVKPCCGGTCSPSQPSSTSPVTSPAGYSQISGHKDKTRQDVKRIAKSVRVADRAKGYKRSKSPMPGSKRSAWKRQYDKQLGRWVTVRRER